jgi:isoprenylcysteine carboxyl methyltransferase (ICMT) family protein YpbQ
LLPRRAEKAEHMKRLARLRVPLGFLFAIAVIWLAQPTRTSLQWGSGLALAGEALRIWAAGHLNKSREVTSSGPYRWLAHPLYVGSSVMGVGLAVASNNLIVAALIVIYLATTITAAIATEEAFLRTAFGDRYDDYRRGGGDSGRRFSVKQVMANREYRALGGLLLAVLLLLIKATYNDSLWRAGPVR